MFYEDSILGRPKPVTVPGIGEAVECIQHTINCPIVKPQKETMHVVGKISL